MTWSLVPFPQLSPLFYFYPCVYGDPFGFPGICVSDCIFGRFYLCIVEIVNGQCQFILGDAEAVPERDFELRLDECVLQQ